MNAAMRRKRFEARLPESHLDALREAALTWGCTMNRVLEHVMQGWIDGKIDGKNPVTVTGKLTGEIPSKRPPRASRASDSGSGSGSSSPKRSEGDSGSFVDFAAASSGAREMDTQKSKHKNGYTESIDPIHAQAIAVMTHLQSVAGTPMLGLRRGWEWDQLCARVKESGVDWCKGVVDAAQAAAWAPMSVGALFGTQEKAMRILVGARRARLSDREQRTAEAAARILEEP